MVEGSKFNESHVLKITKLESKEERNALTFSITLPMLSGLVLF